MKVTIYGSGYVGLVTGVCLAEVGNDVLCMDIDAGKIGLLRQGKSPIHEPGLDELLKENIVAGRLGFTTDVEQAVRHAALQVIAVGTPPDEDGSADLSHVLAVAEGIAAHMDEYRVVVGKSTVPVGTADKVRQKMSDALQQRGMDIEFDVVSNPEFLKEGAAIEDFMKPDRIVVGADNEKAVSQLKKLYAPFSRSHGKLMVMDIRSAELTKYAANAMLATKISFMNELANLAERVGADIEQVRIGIGSDPRIGYKFIYPGCGYGGSCFPKDVRALERTAKGVEYEAELLQAVESVNNRQKRILFQKLSAYFDGKLKGKRIALWGLAFKPNTDDMREASSQVFIECALSEGAEVCVYDPVAADEARRIYGQRKGLELCDSKEEAVKGADALVIVTEWAEFRSPDFDRIKADLKNPLIFDGRNLYDPKHMQAEGIIYYAIGRGCSSVR